MFITLSSFSETPQQLVEGMRHVKEEVIPSLHGVAGLKAGYWAVDRDNGRRISVTVWESLDAMNAAMPKVMASIKRLREAVGLTEAQRSPDSNQRFEVFAQI